MYMKIYAISDLHLSAKEDKPMDIFGGNWIDYVGKIKEDWERKVSDEDIVLIGGDISWAMDIEDAVPDIESLKELKGKKIFIKGNHDYWWSGINKVRDIMPENFYALQNDSVKFGNVVICGSRCWCVPNSPDFKEHDRKIYLRETERLKLSLKSAKGSIKEGDKLVALIHFPPFTSKHEDTLFTQIFEEYNVDAVVFGHLHGTKIKMENYFVKNGIRYYLTSCDRVNNKLTEIDL